MLKRTWRAEALGPPGPVRYETMRLTHRYILQTLTMSALGVAACGDRPVDNTKGSTTASADMTSTTDPTGGMSAITGAEPTTGEPLDSEVYEQCKAYNANQLKLLEAQCICVVASGEYPDLESCLADYEKSPKEADCICRVYGKHPEETKVVLGCFAAPMQTLLECFMKAECSDLEAQQACFSANSEAVLGCPSLSEDVQLQITMECHGEAP